MRTYTREASFEWDEAKNETNIRKHGLDFRDAPELFESPMLVRLDNRSDYGESRWVGVGVIHGRIAAVVYTERNEGETIRIISLRKALRHEQKEYRDLADRLGPDRWDA